MQLIPDLFSPELTHVIGEDNTEAGTVQAVAGGFMAATLEGRQKYFKTFQAALNWLETGRLPKPEKVIKTNQLNLF